MTIIRENKIRIKRGDFGVLPWFIENKDDEQDASAKGEIKTDEGLLPPDDGDDDDDDDSNDEDDDSSRGTPMGDGKKKKKYLANLEDGTPGRSKRKASNVAKTSMKLVSRLSSADGFDGVDHEDSDHDGDDEGEGGHNHKEDRVPSSTTPQTSKHKKNHIKHLFDPARYLADRLKFICLACHKKFDRESDKASHLDQAHPGDRADYEEREREKNETIPVDITIHDMDTFWRACQPIASGVECGICEEKAGHEDQLLAHYYDNHVPALRKKGWQSQRKVTEKYLRAKRQERLQQRQQQQLSKSAKPAYRLLFATWPIDDKNEPKSLLETVGCSQCSLYFGSKRQRRLHWQSVHAQQPFLKHNALAKGEPLHYHAADAETLETLRRCCCLPCGFYFFSSVLRDKHAAGCKMETSTSNLEDGLKKDLWPAYTPKVHAACPECQSTFESDTKKSAHNHKVHGIRGMGECSSDDDTDAEGKEGPGYESLLRLFGCGPCGVLYGSFAGVDAHRQASHGGVKMDYDPATINYDQLRYEEGAEELLEKRCCIPCRIYFTVPKLKNDHVTRAHGGDRGPSRLSCDLKPAHTPGKLVGWSAIVKANSYVLHSGYSINSC